VLIIGDRSTYISRTTFVLLHRLIVNVPLSSRILHQFECVDLEGVREATGDDEVEEKALLLSQAMMNEVRLWKAGILTLTTVITLSKFTLVVDWLESLR
jgi:hypothetical protein